MENFIVSARKYRPATFDTVVGQASITTTLKNAIRNNHLAQAYLFCGPRGVGKTTCARIFAKTINCLSLSAQTEPCGQCESCKSFSESRSYNIHELDAASNNSVDDIRTLCEQVRIPPQIGTYSVYIIDEVHMLSAAAFNAFLKTLEEPPKHAVFILATTEKHKIIPTILSRCQIFDFSRIQIDDTVKFLEKISENEGTEYESDGLNIIAQKADGAMRDALSIYDQIVSFSGGKLSYTNVIENLNVLDYDYYFRLTDAFLTANISSAFLIFDEILAKGFDTHNFVVGLSKHFRDLLICKDTATIQLLEVGQNIKEKYKLQTSLCPSEFLFECLAIVGIADINFRTARNQRLHVELSLVQLCQALNKKKNSDIDEPIVTAAISRPLPAKAASTTVSAPPETVATSPRPASKVMGAPETNRQIAATPSIKNLLKPPAQPVSANASNTIVEEPKIEILSTRTGSFTQEHLLQAYNHFIESIKLTKPRLYSTLLIGPLVKSDNLLEITLSNLAQLEDFNKNVKSEMVLYIREKLENDSINIDIRITEEEEKTGYFTADEKFKHMISKNPILGKMKQQFNLDFD